jgi:hypothetical protein
LFLPLDCAEPSIMLMNELDNHTITDPARMEHPE